MTNVSENTFISHDARVTRLNPGATLPTSISSILDGEDLGWMHTDGETFSLSKTVNSQRAHQNNTILRSTVSDGETTFAATALEDKPLVRSLYWGADEVDGVITANPSAAINGVFVYDTFDTQDGFEKAKRYVFSGLVTANGDLTYNYTDMTGYPLMITVNGDVTIISEADES